MNAYLKGCNRRSNRTHGRTLRSTLSDYELSFYDMLSILNEKNLPALYKRTMKTPTEPKYLNG